MSAPTTRTFDSAPNTITRSMSRKTLSSSRTTQSLAALAKEPPSTSNLTSSHAPRSSLDQIMHARERSSLAARGTKRAIASSSSSSSSSTTGSAVGHGSGGKAASSITAARRRVLAEAKNSGGTTATSSSQLHAAKTKAKIAHGAHVRRMSRAEAAAVPGMGVVRMGPPMVTSPTKRSPTKAAYDGSGGIRQSSSSAPVGKTASSQSRPIGLVSPTKFKVSRSPTNISTLSPMKRSLPSFAFELSPPRRQGMTETRALPDSDQDMDFDLLPVLPSSPFPHAHSPRALVGGESSANRKHGSRADSSDDELDCLSPRKKKLRSVNMSPSADSSSTARPPLPALSPLIGSARSALPRSPSSFTIRSPPKKTQAMSALKWAPPANRPATSASMIRSNPAMPAHPSFDGVQIGVPPPPSSFALPVSSEVLASSGSALPPSPQPHLPPASTLSSTQMGRSATLLPSWVKKPQPSTQTKQSSRPSAPASMEEVAALRAVQLARRQSQDLRASGIPRPAAGLPKSPLANSRTMELDGSTTASESMIDSNVSVGNTSMSEETTNRLANLQSMLSRLQMKRPSLGGASAAPSATAATRRSSTLSSSKSMIGLAARTKDRHNLTGAFDDEFTVPLAPAGDARPSGVPLPRSRTSLPQAQRAPLVSGQLGERRRHSLSARPTSGIVSTANAVGPLAESSQRSARRVSSVLPSSSSTATIASVAEGELSAQPRSNALRGVVAYVDVRTAEGDDSGMVFVDMLKTMGARVTTRPTLTLTHIVYKGGRPGTLQRYRAHPDPKPHLVGITWVVRCHEAGTRVDEKPYAVECSKAPTFTKRRRSMEPKALAALNNGGDTSMETTPALQATIAASIERARRKSMQFAPKIGSPLAKRVFVMPTMQPEADDDD